MSKKTRVELTPEERLKYWQKRINSKVTSAIEQFGMTFKDATNMAMHIGVKSDDIKGVTEKIDEAMQGFVKLVTEVKFKKEEEEK